LLFFPILHVGKCHLGFPFSPVERFVPCNVSAACRFILELVFPVEDSLSLPAFRLPQSDPVFLFPLVCLSSRTQACSRPFKSVAVVLSLVCL